MTAVYPEQKIPNTNLGMSKRGYWEDGLMATVLLIQGCPESLTRLFPNFFQKFFHEVHLPPLHQNSVNLILQLDQSHTG